VSIEIRAVTPDEVADMIAADRRGFGQAPNFFATGSSAWSEGELDRTRVAFEDGAIVGVSRAYSFEVTLPGGVLAPAAAVSWVSVVPTHRRRGILTQMMGALHDDARAREEPAAILTASESVIYGRFGYGCATSRVGYALERTRAKFARPTGDTGRVRFVAREEAEKVLPALYDQVRVARPGMVSRPDIWWSQIFWGLDKPDKAFFVVVHENAAGVADGFAAYEIRGAWNRGIPNTTLWVEDIEATDDTARGALWEFLLGVDLVDVVEGARLPIDEPLRHWVADSRRVRVTFISDGLWLAPLDPQALLSSRTYSEFDGHVVLEVHAPDGLVQTLAVDGNATGARCEPTTAAPDLVLDSATLGACILGGNRFHDYAAAKAVEERRPGALAYADAMFAISPPPRMTSGF
jgi:predicted acetyltransferase